MKSRGVQLKVSHRDLCTPETISEKPQTAQESPLNTPLFEFFRYLSQPCIKQLSNTCAKKIHYSSKIEEIRTIFVGIF